MAIQTNNKIIPLDPVSQETINKLFDILSRRELINIAGIDWMLESWSIDSYGCMIQLRRPGYGHIEIVEYVGTFERGGIDNTMTVSASVLATMMGINKT